MKQCYGNRRRGKALWWLAALVLALSVTLCGCGRLPTEGPSQPGSVSSHTGAESSGGIQPEQSGGTNSEQSSGVSPEQSSETLPEQPPSRAEELLAEMTTEEKVWQLFLVRPEVLTDGTDPVTEPSAVTTLTEQPVGGVILFAQNIETRAQTIDLLNGLQVRSPIPLLLAVDEEGGIVSRIGKNEAMGTTRIGTMASIGETGDPDNARAVGETIGSEIGALGFNLDFAPVADVNSNPDNPIIGNRAFGSDPALVADFVAAAVEGFHQGGMACTLKHFPGHGDTAEDTHTSAASTGKTLEELRSCELLPFAAGIAAGADCVMVAHISAPNAFGDETPASLSHQAVTELLRGELGFEGVVVTDSLRMAAITDHYSSGEAAVKALEAGADILLDPADLNAAVEGVLEAVESGRLTEARLNESVVRILELKEKYGVVS